MTYSMMVGKHKLLFSDTHFKDFRKKPTISVYDADTNSETKIASFNSKETFEWFIEAVVKADRKTENSSEKPNNCDTCKWGEWYRQGYDITMMDDECGGCCSWNSKWTPKTKPTISKMEQVDKDINVRSKDEPQRDCFLCKWLGDVDVCGRCRNRNLFAEADTEPKPKDEPQTERSDR